MLTHLNSMGGGFERRLAIAPQVEPGGNWFTVFIAENGGRKSYLLRCLVEVALGRQQYVPDKGSSILFTAPAKLPRRVIAISGTPLDRFPRTGTRDLKIRRRKMLDDFVYLGPRASNGMAGVAQSERSLVGSLLSNRYRLKERASLLTEAFSSLGLLPRIDVLLQGSSERGGSREKIAESLYTLDQSLGERPEDEALELYSTMEKYRANVGKINRELERLSNKTEARLRLGIDHATIGARTFIDVPMWELLIRLGHVVITGTRFHRIKHDETALGDELSSGQWGWLGTFASLAAEIRDDSLILVDEPENSLHPRWQQEFIRELHAMVSNFRDCQVVVATHSPLIASGISEEWGSIRTLTKPTRKGAHVHSKELPTAFGWSASDVYGEMFGLESTRAPDFMDDANTALRKLSMKRPITDDEREQWITQFRGRIDTLPSHDSMRDVLEGIIARLKKQDTGESPGHGKNKNA